MIVRRDKYLQRLIDRESNGMVKVVTGIRRCGKTYLLFKLFIDHLKESGVDEEHIISIYLDREENKELRDAGRLLGHIGELIRDDGRYYVLLDEIQLVNGFVPLLNSLNGRENISVYVTGSNSNMLSSNIVTEFRGRGDEIRLRPLSFSEFYSSFRGDSYDALRNYMEFGGLPELMNMKSDEQKAVYLKNIVDTTYLLDIRDRFNVKKPFALDNVMNVVSSSSGSLVNISKLKNTMISMGYKAVDEDTISEYLDHFIDSYLFEKCSRYDVKGRKYMTTSFKMYAADPGLINAKLGFRQLDDKPHIMETIIYNELRYRGYDVDTGVVSIRAKDGEHTRAVQTEADFVARKMSQIVYIQSVYSIDDPVKREQELRPLRSIKDSFKKVVIVNDYMSPHMDDNGIMYIGLIQFLLDEDSLSL